ncbi:MAG: 30S ribosomal protein S28e [Candidatus Aenigmarchaeota archaeon]
MPVAAEILQVRGVLGVKGVRTVRARVIEGHDKGKVVVRNVVGHIKEGDIILLKETGMDAEAGMQRR